ncbi:hypothetical protein [Ruminococcus flavefaciens]|uniref:hypothetical protein n=1 Tax=Ruminococcus flavefaciens TaxID=1265 RepID=UPI003F113085
MKDDIKQPKDAKIKADKMNVNLVWNRTFAAQRNAKFNKSQKFVDAECIRRMVRFTPMRNGILMKAPVLGTKIGSGHIVVLSPYGRYQYYGRVMVSRITGSPYARMGESKVLTGRKLTYSKVRHPEATSFYFEHMKKKYKAAIMNGAKKISGGKLI